MEVKLEENPTDSEMDKIVDGVLQYGLEEVGGIKPEKRRLF